ncbi:MAG: GMC family oxidoreductase [Gammaproteobacteria bacterium]|nr:GMC family oxidoreductase [Gammaproteobacteria bacterium]
MTSQATTFPTKQEVDFVVVGSGAAGGVLARELSRAGFDVVVLEQGQYRKAADFTHDEFSVLFMNEMLGGIDGDHPQSFRASQGDKAEILPGLPPALYARTVGGSSVHYSGNFWRFHPIDFNEHSVLGDIESLADWPIDYDELEPYYTKVDWEIGVSGAPGHFDPYRSRPYPVPPLPVKSSGVLFERGAKALGLHPQSAPMAILSKAHNGRPACMHCGFCLAFGCEMNAKSSTLATMIPEAEATGRCEIRSESTVFNLPTDNKGRIREVLYYDKNGNEQAQRCKATILAANGAETPRLLFLSASSRFPQGLANSSGLVGKYLMFNCHSVTHAVFEHQLNEYKSVQCTRISLDFYNSDAKRGFYGGGGLDARPFLNSFPILFGMSGLPPDAPTWGSDYKQLLSEYFTRNMAVLGSTTSLPVASNNISLDPTLNDRFGLPALRVTYTDHEDDLAMAGFLQERAVEILEAAGAKKIWRDPVEPQRMGAHLLGTCRMGDDPEHSVVDRYHRSHDIDNLFICDGSSFVTSGRGQPTMTIQALAFRAAEHIARFAKSNEI